MQRAILHSDANCFYASVEMVLNPELRGKAVAVCGSEEDRHGIVHAKSEKAKKAGCDEAVFHRDGRVTECSHCNIHILKNGVLRTAPADNFILPGVARAHVINMCNQLGIPVDETPFSIEELMDADEVIISSTSTLCIQASEVDGKPVGGKDPETFNKLRSAIRKEFNDFMGF